MDAEQWEVTAASMAFKDYYEILEIKPTATAEEIRDAFRDLTRFYHPDQFTDPKRKAFAESKQKEINVANDTLKDPQKRVAYDAKRNSRNRSSQAGPSGPSSQPPPPQGYRPGTPVSLRICTSLTPPVSFTTAVDSSVTDLNCIAESAADFLSTMALTFVWKFEGHEAHRSIERTSHPTRLVANAIHSSDALPVGNWQVELWVDGTLAGSADFKVFTKPQPTPTRTQTSGPVPPPPLPPEPRNDAAVWALLVSVLALIPALHFWAGVAAALLGVNAWRRAMAVGGNGKGMAGTAVGLGGAMVLFALLPSPNSHPPTTVKPVDTKTKTKTNLKDGAKMIWIPAGEFLMGSDENDDEKPPHMVNLDGYWIYKYEVTVAQYRKFCNETGSNMPEAPSWGWQDDHPIVHVSWDNATAYTQWAGVRLPTEAQWEKAARGTDGRAYPWGNEWDATKCANSVGQRLSSTKPIGSYPSDTSPYGALDMAGNVWEWCADWYDGNYYNN